MTTEPNPQKQEITKSVPDLSARRGPQKSRPGSFPNRSIDHTSHHSVFCVTAAACCLSCFLRPQPLTSHEFGPCCDTGSGGAPDLRQTKTKGEDHRQRRPLPRNTLQKPPPRTSGPHLRRRNDPAPEFDKVQRILVEPHHDKELPLLRAEKRSEVLAHEVRRIQGPPRSPAREPQENPARLLEHARFLGSNPRA